MQKWEYLTVMRRRGWKDNENGEVWHGADSWDMNIKEKLVELGEQGWELVAISARSPILGGKPSVHGGLDYAGFTGEEQWVFKRPKQ
ncbi:MAG TPA: hypothetical protein VF914_15050 [Chloroflexia bacterium]|jgi:hypothetical protein